MRTVGGHDASIASRTACRSAYDLGPTWIGVILTHDMRLLFVGHGHGDGVRFRMWNCLRLALLIGCAYSLNKY